MIRYKLFVVVFFSVIVGLTAVYTTLFRYQFGAPVEAEYWLGQSKLFKRHIAQRMASPKVIVAGGSNVSYGIDSALIGKALGRPAVNLGLHGGLPLDELLPFAASVAQPGDVIVLALEWGFYTNDYTALSAWTIRQTVTWDQDYFRNLSWDRKLGFFKTETPQEVWTNARAKFNRVQILKDHPQRVLLDEVTVVKAYYREREPGVAVYGFLNDSEFGDQQNICARLAIVDINTMYDGVGGLHAHDNTLRLLLTFRREQAQRNIRVFLAPPPMVLNDSTKQDNFRRAIRSLMENLEKAGLPVLGDPVDFIFPVEYFHDTRYHLNCVGRTLRTKQLIKLMQSRM